jgi:hypothetical protein
MGATGLPATGGLSAISTVDGTTTDGVGATTSGVAEREMCPWVISKYFGDWVPTQVLKCEFMLMDEQSANQE